MSVAWSWAFDTPFKWTKQVASHFGGTRQGMAISWPGHIKDAGGIRTQFHHMIDIVPTILEADRHPGARDGRRHRAEADRRREHGLHLRQGQRRRAVDAHDAVFRDVRQPRASITTAGSPPRPRRRRPGCWARPSCPTSSTATSGSSTTSPRTISQDNDLAAKMPDKLQRDAGAVPGRGGEVQRASRWTTRSCSACSTPRPSATAGRTVFTYSGEMSGLPDRRRARAS